MQKKRLPEIDGLRALACLAVVSYHSNYLGYTFHVFPESEPAFWRHGHWGNLGVEVFFILSAFCLAYPMFRLYGAAPDRPSQSANIDWRRYARNRIRRILPPYYASFALFAALGIWINAAHIEPFASSHFLTFPGIKHIIQGLLLIGTEYNSVFWTLCVEARWYLLLPLFVILILKNPRRGIPVVIGMSALMHLLYNFVIFPYMKSGHRSVDRVEFVLGKLLLFAPLFAIGVVIAYYYAHPDSRPKYWDTSVRRAPAFLALAAAVAVVMAPFQNEIPYNYGRVLVSFPLAVFALLAAFGENRFSAVLRSRPLVAVGMFSYSIYLTHEPVIRMIYMLIQTRAISPILVEWLSQTIILVGLVLLGYIFFLIAERPFLHSPPSPGEKGVRVKRGKLDENLSRSIDKFRLIANKVISGNGNNILG